MINRNYFIILFVSFTISVIAITKTNNKRIVLKKNYAEIHMSTDEAIKIYKHWLEGAYSGVIAALANQRYILRGK